MINANVIAGMFGALFVTVLILVLLTIFKCHDYSPIYILNNNKEVMAKDSIYILTNQSNIEFANSAKVKLLKELEAKGILLTPQEYTSNIVNYYNSLITFLIGLFVVFSFIGYFSLRLASKKDILNTLDELLDDSIKFKNTTVKSISTILADSFVNKEELDNKIESIKRDFEAELDAIKQGIPVSDDETIV